jgi:putative tricarboxylic transport membrane protein
MFGVLGYVFRKVDIPLAPLVLALVLGGMMEQSFRQAMTLSGGNPKIFVGSVLTVGLAVLSTFIIGLTLHRAVSRRKRTSGATQATNSP